MVVPHIILIIQIDQKGSEKNLGDTFGKFIKSMSSCLIAYVKFISCSLQNRIEGTSDMYIHVHDVYDYCMMTVTCHCKTIA